MRSVSRESVAWAAVAGAAGQADGVAAQRQIPVPLGIGIARVPRPGIEPPLPWRQGEMGPAGCVRGVSRRLTPACFGQAIDDAVVSSVGAIFPMPNRRAETLAAADEVPAGTIELYLGP